MMRITTAQIHTRVEVKIRDAILVLDNPQDEGKLLGGAYDDPVVAIHDAAVFLCDAIGALITSGASLESIPALDELEGALRGVREAGP